MYLATKPSNLDTVSATLFVVSAYYTPQVLGIEPRRESGRADKVDEHDCELAALRAIVRSELGSCGWRRCARGCVGKLANCAQQLLTVPERDANFLKVLVCQIVENAGIDVIFGKTLRVLPEANCIEPVRYLLHRGHRLSRLA